MSDRDACEVCKGAKGQERERAAYQRGQRDMRERAAERVWCGNRTGPRSDKPGKYDFDLAQQIRALTLEDYHAEPDQTTDYCGVALIGGWCKERRGHEGEHVCS